MKSPSAYAPPTFRGTIDLQLSRNEGRAPRDEGLYERRSTPEMLSRYPDIADLRAAFGRRLGLPSGRVLVTAGGDDALMRTCLATLEDGLEALVATPTFEMIPRYIGLARGVVNEVQWPQGPFPTDAFIAAASERTAVAFVVSPNNPTGAVATSEDIRRVARALPDTLIVLDAAYGEFDDDDPTTAALELDNVVVVRTLSKAWGLAGLRVGCLLGKEAWISRLAACGNPFPVSAVSAAIAVERLTTGEGDVDGYVARARTEREELSRVLGRLGARPSEPTAANFVLARGLDPAWTTAAAGALGVALRAFPDRSDLDDAVRITVPGNEEEFARLTAVLETALMPEALLFDLDGVLADVSGSYRAAILATAESFGVSLTGADVERAKARGNANDDWALTRALIVERGVDATLEDVTARFEQLYQGSAGREGLASNETPLVSRARLDEWHERFKTAIVTGRPRADALHFLERFDLLGAFDALVCREDAPLKPDPAPVRIALEQLGVRRAWMLGDTRDDLHSARAAGVVPIGVVPPQADAASLRANLETGGAALVLDRTTQLGELLP